MPTPIPTPTATPFPTPTPTPILPTPTPTPMPQFFLHVGQPIFGAIVTTPSITVRGATLPNSTVTANRIFAAVDDTGEFQVQVNLNQGLNIVEVLSTSAAGRQLREFLQITFVRPTPTPFTLTVSQPRDADVVSNPFINVIGKTHPQANVIVNRVGVTVQPDGSFATTLRLNRGVNTVTVFATFQGSPPKTETRRVIYNP